MGRYNKRECFLDYTILERQVVQSLLIMIYKTQSSKNTLSGLSAKSSPDLGMSLLSTVGQNDHEMSPKIWSNVLLWVGPVNYKLALVIDTYHLPLQELNHVPLQLLIFNAAWKEFRVDGRNKTLCAWGKKVVDSWIFLEANFMIQILVSPHV